MAIIFTKEISENKIINAFNNNEVVFHSDTANVTAVSCDIIINSKTFRISPNTNGVFRFNFGGNNSIFTTLINQNNFSDEIVLNINPLDIQSLIIDDTNNSFLIATTSYTINFSDGTTESITKNYNVLKSVRQDDDDRVLDISFDNFYFLNPVKNNENKKVTYFKGYPFCLSFFSKIDNTIDFYLTNGSLTNINIYKHVGRLQISDGLNDINSFVTLNKYDEIEANANTADLIQIVTKDECGEYIKFMNRFGQWNYWLFNAKSKHDIKTKNGKSIFNDFYNVTENRSPELQSGFSGNKIITLHSRGVKDYEMTYLQDLFISPKIYYYLGNKNEKTTQKKWIEVKLKSSKKTIKNYKSNTFNVDAVIELPQLNTMRL